LSPVYLLPCWFTVSPLDLRRHAHAELVRSGRLACPDALPIGLVRDELLATIRDHQVVVVAGETGSGKSTQLPKLCLELGRGVGGLIGHTQPRRVAARTIAERVADEIGSRVGEQVGYTVRFNDRVGPATLVRVMTDGILLAELQRDRMLGRYDTIIVDEAHERSLNIDFILGYLRQLLPTRPELKVIVTSATIDTERFAQHFDIGGVAAPVVEVTGRTYPVEVRYRPLDDTTTTITTTTTTTTGGTHDKRNQRDQVQAICDAVEELQREGPGDVLVFLSGEREIHDTADALRRLELPGTDILPLYARLSSHEQHRVFAPHPGRRIVLSTNVAETSLTVPGVRYVVDTGTARISRYSRRLKVQRLPIEPVSQASADQRAGRCGRVAPGICIRLYSEDDFEDRPEFTEPEILRTNLASVILQMTAIGLGDVASFPFVEPPDTASIRDGYLLLEELGAIEPADGAGVRRLTRTGRRLARLPVDPRIGRMVLEAERHGCVREVLVIAAALSIQDPRERPAEHRERATELHRRFDVAGSDLLSIVALWDHLREQQRQLSSNQFRRLCRSEFLNYLRIREWQDLFSQLRQVAGELGIRSGAEAGHPDRVHQAVLAGLLSHLGTRDRDAREYLGARGSRFVIAPGSVLSRKGPRWVMAAELVETHRLHARRVATIQPEWAEQVGAHLVKRSYGEPYWDARRGAAVTTETVMLYGLPIVTGRVIGYDRVDPAIARAMFIRHALVDGDWSTGHRFVVRNREFLDRVRELEIRVRRVDLIDDEALEAFYGERVGADVVSARHFDRWWKRTGAEQPGLLDLTDEVLRDAGIGPQDFPDAWQHDGVVLPLTYRFEPGDPLDGVTVRVPLTLLNQVNAVRFDWQVPGHRAELVTMLVRSLPKDIRRHLIPASDTVRAVLDRLGPPEGRLVDAVAAALRQVAGVEVSGGQFDPTVVPPYLRMNFVIHGGDGTVVDAGSDLDAIKTRQASAVRAAIAGVVPLDERRGIVSWDVGTVPRVVEARDAAGHAVRGHPALLDDGDSVSLRVLTNAALQERVMRGGVRRLLALTVVVSTRALERMLGDRSRLSMARCGISLAELVDDCRLAALDRVMTDHGELPWTAASFAELQRTARDRSPAVAADALSAAADIVEVAAGLTQRLEEPVALSLHDSYRDALDHLGRLVHPGFVVSAGPQRLPDLLRFVRGLEYRLDRLAGEVTRDHRRMAEVIPLEQRHRSLVRTFATATVPPEVTELGWQLEELRLAVFAQAIGVRGQVSAARIGRALDALGA
jgi:ATP-dependent helicase HrpA